MRWEQGRTSSNVEDRRGMRVPGGAPVKLGGGMLLLVAVGAILLGENPLRLIGLIEQVGGQVGGPAPGGAPGGAPGTGAASDPESDRLARFSSVVLADTEDVWGRLLAARGGRYEPPTLVLFTDQVDSACGFASAASGPFYCPADRKLYLDLGFFAELDRGFGAPGDFAQAYVIAHEVGHHVQTLLGLSEQVARASRGHGEAERNALSVRQELQADCLAGVWGHDAAARGLLEPGDAEEGLAAAAAIGDDRLQREARGRVSPESWTHGSSADRSRWLRTGLQGGRLEDCDTFAAGAGR